MTDTLTIRLTMSLVKPTIITGILKCEFLKICKGCGKQFITENQQKEFCTRSHKNAFWKKNREE